MNNLEKYDEYIRKLSAKYGLDPAEVMSWAIVKSYRDWIEQEGELNDIKREKEVSKAIPTCTY